MSVNIEAPILPPRRKRGRPKVASDEVRSAQIVQKAEALFLESGFLATTMDAIAAACHMSKQTLYRLFPSKIDLIAASVAHHRFSMLAPPPEDDHCPLDLALQKIFRIDIDVNEDARRTSFLRFLILESSQIPELHDIVMTHGAGPSRDDLAQWLAKQSALGRLDLDDPQFGAQLLMDMIFGVAVPNKVQNPVSIPDPSDRKTHIRRCIRVFLHGVAR